MLKEIQKPGVSVIITHEGLPEGVFLSFEEFERWQETMEVMMWTKEDPSVEEDLMEGIREIKTGKLHKDAIPLAEVKKRLKR